MGDEWILVHAPHGVVVAREVLVLRVQHVCVRRQVREPFEHGEREIRCRHLEREALQMSPASSDWCSTAYKQATTPPALWPSMYIGSPSSRDFSSHKVLS